MLMKSNSFLDIQEHTRIHRFGTFLFGLLGGFWRFEDFELRPTYCILSQQGWTEVLNSSGFEVDGILPIFNNHHSLIWAVKTATMLELPREMMNNNRKTWLLFQRGDENGAQIETYLKKRVGATTSRRVITVHAGKKMEHNLESLEGGALWIRKDVEEDYNTLFKTLKAEQVDLEGIIYCWSILPKNGGAGATLQEEILRPHFYLTKTLLTVGFSGRPPRILGVTNGAVPVGDVDLTNFPLSTLWGFTRSLKNENNEMKIKLVDVEGEHQLEEVFYELWNFEKENLLAYREGTRFIPKLVSHKPLPNVLKLPQGTDRFQLILPASRSISDLQFGPLDAPTLEEEEVEVQIKASALNFRDLLSVIKPSKQFDSINAVGLDVAGVVKRVGENVTKFKVGDRVCGCNTDNNALPSHLTFHQNLLIPVPDNLTLCEAATLPAVSTTSMLCLLDVAKITKDDTVLIHTASGGVGLSAIEICKSVGCKIIATAGSTRKKNYLRGLGIQHIFHSRNTQFGDQILELTSGRGVDVVLNSLTSEGFKEATLKACGKGARFIEMSKLNVWTGEEVKKLRPDVVYTIVDVSSANQEEFQRLIERVKALMGENKLRGIPYVRFDALNIREALSYMQKAKHIGKIVCVMPELKTESGERKVNTPMFNNRSTYLITGGLGGIGITVCEWMLEKGATHIIVASRSVPTPSTQAKIEEMKGKGANVIPVQLDVGSFEQCQELLHHQILELGLPPLRGVMHAAGTLSDGLINKLDWAKLCPPFNSKVDGTLNLHKLTKHLDLEFFVTFSSMAALFGPTGQCNHAAGNCFEDTFIHYRNSIGLPATTVNWGQWGQVGIATEVDLPGFKTLSNLHGLAALEYALKTQHTQLAVINVESFQIMSKLFPHLAVYLDEHIWKSKSVTLSPTVKSDEFWLELDSTSESDERMLLVKTQLKTILRATLKLNDGETIGEDTNIEKMGADSLMFVEIRNSIQAVLGERVVVSSNALNNCNTINLLAGALVDLIDEKTELLIIDAPVTQQEVNELIKKDCALPEHITAKPEQKLGRITDISCVLLTGCTGTLGPFVLKELTSLAQIKQVVCIVRSRKKGESGKERLQKALEKNGLLGEVDMGKVVFVSGNVALPQLGISPNVWLSLSESVDAIFNCSARVMHTELYRYSTSETDTRAVNVGGMKNLLEFACVGKLKHFCNASSFVASFKKDEEGYLSEDWPFEKDYDNVTKYAYPITKFVGDYLAKLAVERGIPCKVIRLPLITGSEKSGYCNLEGNHLLLRYMFVMKSGCMPAIPFPVVALPVDTCADAFIRLFFDERTPSGVYNVIHGNPDVDQAFVNVAKRFGHHVELVEASEFLTRVEEDRRHNAALQPFKDMYTTESQLMSAILAFTSITQGDDVFKNKKVTTIIPNFYENQLPSIEYIYRDLLFLKQEGWFEKFGL